MLAEGWSGRQNAGSKARAQGSFREKRKEERHTWQEYSGRHAHASVPAEHEGLDWQHQRLNAQDHGMDDADRIDSMKGHTPRRADVDLELILTEPGGTSWKP